MGATFRELAGAQPTALSPFEVWDRVDPLGADLGLEPSIEGLGALPYQELLGPGFERLCFELLIAKGHSPRFFGRIGQRDYGVDIVVEAGAKCTVYQCKNLTKSPRWPDVRDAVAKFESDWLGEANMARPERYVYCCSQPLDDVAFGVPWTRYKDDFQKRTGVEIVFLDRHQLDANLRRLPDIVAGRFSDSYAEHFCNCDGWHDDPWTRVRKGESRHASIRRFLDRYKQSAIHVSDQEEERFRILLASSSVLAIRGAPGSGKTLTSLEHARRLTDPVRRIYYTTLKDSTDADRLWQSVRRRNSLPAVFLLDDCHLDLAKAGIVLRRLGPELSGPKGTLKLLVILRGVPGSPSEELDATPDWLLQLQEEDAAIEMRTDTVRTRAVTEHLRPEWVGLSRQRLERVHHVTGGDLLLLDELLSSVQSPNDLEGIQPEDLYGPLRSRYFGGNRGLPTLRKLVALAQFELAPHASFLDECWQQGERELVAPLMTELFAPPRYQFLHSSLAELVLQALLELEVGASGLEGEVAETTTSDLIAYLRRLLASGASGAAQHTSFAPSLEMVMRGRLHLAKGSAEAQIKTRVLVDETVRQGIETNLDRFTFSLLHICLGVLSKVEHPAKELYARLAERRFSVLFERWQGGSDVAGLATVGTGFRTLAHYAPSTLKAVQEEHGPGRFLRLIASNGTLFELFHILRHATPDFREELFGELDEDRVEKLVNKTIAAGRSIESFHHTLRALAHTRAHRERLQESVRIDGWLALLVGAGTLNSLSRLTEAMSDGFRGQLREAFSAVAIPEWREMIARGQFRNACSFATNELVTFSAASQAAFCEALRETAPRLSAEASWSDLNLSPLPTDSEAPGTQILREALEARAEAVKLDELVGLDFREAVRGLAFVWRERPDLRPELAAQLWDILPDPADWPRKNGEIAALRSVLFVARSEVISPQDAQRLLAEIETFLDREVCLDTPTMPLFLLMWNIAALRYERETDRVFDGILPDDLIEKLLKVLGKRVCVKGPLEEKLAQLALAGLLGFVAPRLDDRLHEALTPLARSAQRLQTLALDRTFVPALFALEGIALLGFNKDVFTPLICLGLLAKSKEYEDVGTAIEHLREHVEHYSEQR